MEDVIGLAQIKSGKFTKILDAFSIKTAVEDIISIQKLSAVRKRVSISCSFYNFPEDGLSSNYTVYSDIKRFQQVLLNLQSNSLKFSIAGDSIKIKVHFVPCINSESIFKTYSEEDLIFDHDPGLNDEDTYFLKQNEEEYKSMFQAGDKAKLVVSVLDTGMGIQIKDQRNLFKMFSSVNKGGLNSNGIGLGLFICKSIVQQFDGKLVARSKYQEGSMFTFCFEIDPPPLDLVSKAPQVNSHHFSLHQFHSVNRPNSSSHRKIIIADDEPFNFMKMLKVPDIETTIEQCFNGQEVVDLVQQSILDGDPFRYGLIITDCSMPILDGYAESVKVRELLAAQSPS